MRCRKGFTNVNIRNELFFSERCSLKTCNSVCKQRAWTTTAKSTLLLIKIDTELSIFRQMNYYRKVQTVHLYQTFIVEINLHKQQAYAFVQFLIQLKIGIFAHLSSSIFMLPTLRSKNFLYTKIDLKTLLTQVVTKIRSEVRAYVKIEKIA